MNRDVALIETAEYINGMGFSPADWSKEGFPIIRIQQITDPDSVHDFYNGIVPEKHLIRKGDLVFSWSATLKVVMWDWYEGALNQHLFKVIPREGFDKTFLYYILDFNMEKIGESSQGSTMRHVKRSDLGKFKVKIPPLPVQRKIAHILSTVDRQIEKTEQLIRKYEMVKEGMMQDLFTRGIDLKTGKLRPTYDEAPGLYKESELGWIPKEWEVKRLGEAGEFKNGLNKDKESFGYGTPFVNIIDAFPEVINMATLGRVNVNNSEKETYRLLTGDIIFVRSSVKPDGVGYNTLFLDGNETIIYCGFMIRYRLHDKRNYIPEFYNNYFRFLEFRRTLIRISTVSANTNVNQENLKMLLAIKPILKEQMEILLKIQTAQRKVELEKHMLSQYHFLKFGLMQDLLTGKISVPV